MSADEEPMTPRRWWIAIRSTLEHQVTSVQFMSWSVNAAARRYENAKARYATWLLARMDEFERGLTLEAALDDRQQQAGRHPRVAWHNAINSQQTSRCFTSVAEAFDAAVNENPFNNTRLSVGWCTEDHSAAPS